MHPPVCLAQGLQPPIKGGKKDASASGWSVSDAIGPRLDGPYRRYRRGTVGGVRLTIRAMENRIHIADGSCACRAQPRDSLSGQVLFPGKQVLCGDASMHPHGGLQPEVRLGNRLLRGRLRGDSRPNQA